MTKYVTVMVSMSPKPDELEVLLSMLPDFLSETIDRPGVISTRALRNPDEPSKLMFLDVFSSIEASKAYSGWRQENGDLDRLGAMLSEPPRIEIWPVSIESVWPHAAPCPVVAW